MIRKSLITTVLILAAFISRGQEYDTQNEAGVTVGQSTISILLKQVLNDDDLKYRFSGTPVYTVQYDRYVNTWLSLGGAFSRQTMDVKFEEYVDNDGILQEGDFNATFARHVLQFRAFAFYEINEWRFRAGPRIGLSLWGADTDVGNRELKFIDRVSNAVLPGVGVLLLGINYRPISAISIGTEVNLFSPYVVGGTVLCHF